MRLRDQLRGDVSEALFYSPPKSMSDMEIIRNYFRLYQNCLEFANTIALSRNKIVFHFVQPNQYVRDSKIFSDEEEKSCRNIPNRFENIDNFYPLILETIKILSTQGIPSYDLTMVFKHTTETVYKDNCCHLNDQGNDILVNAVIDRILSSSLLTRE